MCATAPPHHGVPPSSSQAEDDFAALTWRDLPESTVRLRRTGTEPSELHAALSERSSHTCIQFFFGLYVKISERIHEKLLEYAGGEAAER